MSHGFSKDLKIKINEGGFSDDLLDYLQDTKSVWVILFKSDKTSCLKNTCWAGVRLSFILLTTTSQLKHQMYNYSLKKRDFPHCAEKVKERLLV